MLYLHHVVKLGLKSAVVRTLDTDIFFILLHYSGTINFVLYLDTGMGRHHQLVNVTELANLLGYYVFTGEDCTSTFNGKGKVAQLKKLQKDPIISKGFQVRLIFR